MSELRKDFGDKAKEAITPDSNKSEFTKAKETVTDKVDNAAGSVQKESGEKGYVQQAKDAVSGAFGK